MLISLDNVTICQAYYYLGWFEPLVDILIAGQLTIWSFIFLLFSFGDVPQENFAENMKTSCFRSFYHCESLEKSRVFFIRWMNLVRPVENTASRVNNLKRYRQFYGSKNPPVNFLLYFRFCAT